MGVVIAQAITGSAALALPFGALGAVVPEFFAKRKREERRQNLLSCWPELLDHLISGMRSGLSIPETIVDLGQRGPEISRPIFRECKSVLQQGGTLDQALDVIRRVFSDPIADQVCEVLRFARGTGSRDTALALRTLTDFIRSDNAVRGEIHAKLGWIRNSAVVAAVAPWILLIILSTQTSTVRAYSSSSGHLILGIGLILSALAYLWMARVGRIPLLPRIFIPVNKITYNEIAVKEPAVKETPVKETAVKESAVKSLGGHIPGNIPGRIPGHVSKKKARGAST
jgi:tight adherence protein B